MKLLIPKYKLILQREMLFEAVNTQILNNDRALILFSVSSNAPCINEIHSEASSRNYSRSRSYIILPVYTNSIISCQHHFITIISQIQNASLSVYDSMQSKCKPHIVKRLKFNQFFLILIKCTWHHILNLSICLWRSIKNQSTWYSLHRAETAFCMACLTAGCWILWAAKANEKILKDT